MSMPNAACLHHFFKSQSYTKFSTEFQNFQSLQNEQTRFDMLYVLV
jgi:hypothetical protein